MPILTHLSPPLALLQMEEEFYDFAYDHFQMIKRKTLVWNAAKSRFVGREKQFRFEKIGPTFASSTAAAAAGGAAEYSSSSSSAAAAAAVAVAYQSNAAASSPIFRATIDERRDGMVDLRRDFPLERQSWRR